MAHVLNDRQQLFLDYLRECHEANEPLPLKQEICRDLRVSPGARWVTGSASPIPRRVQRQSRAPAKSRFVPICPMPQVVARRHATALAQAGSQIPATGMFRHLVQTATLPGP
jgi:hypothetical protein